MSITKQTIAKQHTVEQLEMYQLLVKNIEDYAIFLLDAKGYIASWNLGAERLKGYQPEEIIGKHFSIFYRPIDIRQNKPQIELDNAIANGRVEDEGWRVRKDGTRFWANVVVTSLYDKQGKHRGFAKVTRDLTMRKQYEDNLANSNEMLQRSYQELQAINATKDEFVSLASHQLRTPATGVKQYLSLLLGGFAGDLSELQRDYLQKAYESNDRQIEIVSDLLKVAQVDAGKVILQRKTTDIKDMVTDIIDEQIDSFKNRKQTLTLDLPAKSISANIDPERVRMVLENIIDNASKYTMEKGMVSIKVSDSKEDVKISIKDSGVGIAKADIGRLFEKFSRIQNKLTKDVTGSGLGLYWANKIVSLHGGEIQVHSGKGKGSTFTICMPKVEPRA